MKFKKEIKIGIIAVLAITVVITGVNFLKGSSFLGNDDFYYGYFPNSGGLLPASSVAVNGVGVGKVISIDYMINEPSENKVRVKFNIQNTELRIPKGTEIQIGSLDLFNKAVILNLSTDLSKGYYKKGAKIQGTMAKDMVQQVQDFADPITQKLQTLMSNVDKVVNSLSSFWDTTATSEIKSSLIEVRLAIKRFSSLSVEMESLVVDEKQKLSSILQNVSSITYNLEKSNSEISSSLGNIKIITDDMVKSNFKGVIQEAHGVISKLNTSLKSMEEGKGTLSKLLNDDKFYNELVITNKKVQELTDDIKVHPERYIRVSVFGGKIKGVPLSSTQEKKLKKILDSIP